MGSLASRERPLSIPPAAADTTQPPLPTQAASSSFLALALCDFPSGAGVATVLRMGELLRILSEDGEWWLVVSEVSGKECHIPSSCVAKIRYRWLYEGISRQKAEELLLQPGNRSGSFLIRESQTRQGCYSLSVRRSERASWDSVTHYRIHRLENGWVYISPGLTFPSLHDLVDHYSGNTLPLPSTLSWGGAVGGNTLRLTGREGGKVAATPHLPRCPQGWGTGQGGTLLTLPPPCPEFGEGLCCALREPCSMEGARAAPVPAMPAVVKKPSLNWDKIDSSLLFSEATAPLEEDSPISLGLREAISSYLLVTETGPCRERKE
ncbi:src-like-adapter 2 isoform X3 [Falco rusticolus]|uniref:src-like-adapter 2 isoform X3 n=1 Tax=Falco rusticolus TaxID=120794 RepID=UPI0018869F7E|nr:src-like-adapter 2 isoform X3 [Falco rusticolus]